MKKNIYTSESVTEGHPDKICDLIADAILDDCLRNDTNSKVACEVMGTKNKIIIAGEITSQHRPEFEKVAKNILYDIGCYHNDLQFEILINKQSHEIASKVNKSYESLEMKSKDKYDLMGAGDQGIMYGYATNETPEFLPESLVFARRITNRLTKLRKENLVKGLKPDGKSQVTVEKNKVGNSIIKNIIISTQHSKDVSLVELREQLEKHIMGIFKNRVSSNTEILINPAGSFTQGGFGADTGLTGRKLQVDSYGGVARHGGGALSGKDPSKVDRSGAYICRYIAKNLVASGICKKCEVSISYSIGKAKPTSFNIEFFNTQSNDLYTEEAIEEIIVKMIDLRPVAIISRLGLFNSIYYNATRLCNFGNNILPWEKLDLVEQINKEVKKI